MTDTVYDEMAECFDEAAAMIRAYNEETAETGQRITHQGRIIPQVAMMLFQAKMWGPTPDDGSERGYE